MKNLLFFDLPSRNVSHPAFITLKDQGERRNRNKKKLTDAFKTGMTEQYGNRVEKQTGAIPECNSGNCRQKHQPPFRGQECFRTAKALLAGARNNR
jgi:hypothetical protein